MNHDIPIVIRPMQSRDVPVVTQIAKMVMPYSWSESIFQDCLQGDYQAWVMQQGSLDIANAVLGFIVSLVQVGEGQILKVAIRQRVQGQGYGRQLVEHALTKMQQDINRIFLEVRISNSQALAFYQSLGFKAVGQRRDYYRTDDGREDAVIMEKVIEHQTN
ncbi:MAG: ribosomal-protein-alanine N-acetyltransferase [Coxiellaceae bacterium]|nr:ribosomal-protein-alanine N-acetyltransferase [Coxiellaceae bacterium]|tara:strand:- start:1248 stop:1730 length:483 start_codon:yes stop_codon:yes gene_type:complete